jgi:hypothetical protein
MSTSGRYQSRLFSFFSQQTLRLKDKAGQVWRQTKLAATWGAQILLYPVYLVFQTGRLAGRQMGRAAQVFPSLGEQAEPVDRPIQQVLAAVQRHTPTLSPAAETDTLSGTIATQSSADLSFSGVQGIASLLVDRRLVLVSADNQILNILTTDQQHDLQQRIAWAMARFWRRVHERSLTGDRVADRSAGEQQRLAGPTFLPLLGDRAQALPPVRALRRLMAWMQTSPVAIATNLFQESRLAPLGAGAWDIDAVGLDRNIDPFDRLEQSDQLDQRVNELFEPRPSAPPVLDWMKRQAAGLTEFSRSLTAVVQGTSMVIYDPMNDSVNDSVNDLVNDSVNHPSEAQDLSDEQVRDRLGDLLNQTPYQKPPKHSSKTPKKPRRKMPGETSDLVVEPKPWLSEEDFFDGEFLGQDLTVYGSTDESTAIESNEEGASAQVLEAEISSVEYVKHPLEQLLQWLDAGMLWIEQRLARVCQWLGR